MNSEGADTISIFALLNEMARVVAYWIEREPQIWFYYSVEVVEGLVESVDENPTAKADLMDTDARTWSQRFALALTYARMPTQIRLISYLDVVKLMPLEYYAYCLKGGRRFFLRSSV